MTTPIVPFMDSAKAWAQWTKAISRLAAAFDALDESGDFIDADTPTAHEYRDAADNARQARAAYRAAKAADMEAAS